MDAAEERCGRRLTFFCHLYYDNYRHVTEINGLQLFKERKRIK